MKNTHGPRKVSIGMPIYNGALYVREALDSLLAQTFVDFELIISDNASTDETEVICREYMMRDSRISFTRQVENKGAAANFQFVLNKAKGEYFMWAACDDRWDNRFIEECLRVFNDDPECELVFTEFIVMNLIDGESVRHRSALSNSDNKRTNYLTRLINPDPSLVYGLHRRSNIIKNYLGNYDYADIHLTHVFALNYKIKILPFCYFITGTTGKKGLYSVAGNKYISPWAYLKKECALLYSKFGFFEASILYLFCSYICIKNTYYFNKMISHNLKNK